MMGYRAALVEVAHFRDRTVTTKATLRVVLATQLEHFLSSSDLPSVWPCAWPRSSCRVLTTFSSATRSACPRRRQGECGRTSGEDGRQSAIMSAMGILPREPWGPLTAWLTATSTCNRDV